MAKTAYRKPKKKVHVFDIVNYIVFILIGLLVLVPIWKVVVDSFNAVGVYQFRLWPEDFTLDGYKTIIHTQRLYRPFINSVITTVLGTFLGLLLSTLGGYVLIQFDMPGRNFFAYFLLFTMIFSGGMIPEYLVMKQLHLVNSMWILVVKHGMNVYNLVLMRNFFEGIPASLFEAAEIDGANAFDKFFRITMPCVAPVLVYQGILNIINSFQYFTQVYVIINASSGGGASNASGGPANSILMYPLYLFNTAFSYMKMGRASAMAWLLFVIVFVLTLVMTRITKKVSENGVGGE